MWINITVSWRGYSSVLWLGQSRIGKRWIENKTRICTLCVLPGYLDPLLTKWNTDETFCWNWYFLADLFCFFLSKSALYNWSASSSVEYLPVFLSNFWRCISSSLNSVKSRRCPSFLCSRISKSITTCFVGLDPNWMGRPLLQLGLSPSSTGNNKMWTCEKDTRLDSWDLWWRSEEDDSSSSSSWWVQV